MDKIIITRKKFDRFIKKLYKISELYCDNEDEDAKECNAIYDLIDKFTMNKKLSNILNDIFLECDDKAYSQYFEEILIPDREFDNGKYDNFINCRNQLFENELLNDILILI